MQTLPITISHEGYLEILITALGVVAAVFSLGAAILGFLGFQSVKQEASTSAERSAREQAEKIAKDEVSKLIAGELHALATEAVRRALREQNLLDQGAALGMSEAEDVSTKGRSMDNVVIRPVKRVVNDAELKESENEN